MNRRVIFISGIIALSLAIAALGTGFVQIKTSWTGRFLFLVFLNLNISALGVLVFYVIRSLIGLYRERRLKTPGYRFKTKMVVLFVVLVSIPAGLLFITSFGLGSNYIERLFTPQFRRPVERSLEMAKAVYEAERHRALEAAAMALSGRIPPSEYEILRLSSLPDDASEAMKTAFEGKPSVEGVSEKQGDMVRAVVPDGRGGVVIAQAYVPQAIASSARDIKEAYEDYANLESWRGPLKLHFFMIMGFSTLVVVFLALWASLRAAGKITEPVKGLVEATEAVAAGDLSARVETKSADEMGLLVNSFNHMVSEIREGRESLQKAYSESDRRRVWIENMVENIQSGVFALSGEGRVIMINSSALRILGISAQDVIGEHYERILSGIESEELKKFIKGINLRTFRHVEREVGAEVGGNKVVLRITIAGIKGASGEHMGLLIVFDDITGLIKAQRALAWQEVARRIAHEIKNPLTPIKLSTERMLKKWHEKDEDFGTVFERGAATIGKEVEGLKRLVDEFSRFGKMPEVVRRPTSVRGVIEEAIGLYKAYKGIRFTVDGKDMTLELDGEQFKRVLINLFDNAIESMTEADAISGSIEVVLRKDDSRAYVEVRDTGRGIAEPDREKLFLPYFSTKKHGSGLGLAIADRIVSEHGGYITAGNNSPKGSAFIIDLPLPGRAQEDTQEDTREG